MEVNTTAPPEKLQSFASHMLEESLQQLGKRRVSWWTTTLVHNFRNSSILFICARNLVISDFLGKIFNQEVRNTLKRNTPYKLKVSRMTIDEVSSQDEHNSQQYPLTA